MKNAQILKQMQRALRYIFALGASAVLLASGAYAAVGEATAVQGDVTVLTATRELKVLRVGERLNPEDVVTTGKQGMALLKLDDQTLVALQADSQLLIEEVRANGDAKDALKLRLRWGGLRLNTGWIADLAPANYQIFIDNTKIQALGAGGLEVQAPQGQAIVLQGYGNSWGVSHPWGATTLPKMGAVQIERQQTTAPRATSLNAKGLFAASPLDEAFARQAADNNAGLARTLQARRNQSQADGGQSASGNPAIPRACGEGSETLAAFQAFIRAYEQGDTFYIQQRLEPSMLGYQVFLEGVRLSMQHQRQVRMLIKDLNTQCASDVAVVNFNWEKRYFDVLTAQPQLQFGQASALLYLKDGLWRMTGITGDNPFVAQTTTGAARIVLSKSISVGGATGFFMTSAPVLNRPVLLQVFDPKMAGQGSVKVRLLSANGDVETISLLETARGIFSVASLPMQIGVPVVGDGVVQVSSAAPLTVQYVDQAPGGNRPATVISARAALAP